MDFKISSLNVNSLVEYRRKHLLNEFIRENPSHLFLIQETKFGPGFNYFHSSYSSFSSSNRIGCGGVPILLRSELRVRNLVRLAGPIDAVFLDVLLGGEWISIGSV